MLRLGPMVYTAVLPLNDIGEEYLVSWKALTPGLQAVCLSPS